MTVPDMPKSPPRAWQRMLSGRRLDLLHPSPDDIEIEDIAHGLARVARWNGQTVGEHAFSVAQHCLVVTEIVAELHADASRQFLRAALLHDAAEYVIGDLISPFKAAIGLDYRAFETRLLSAIHERFAVTDLSDAMRVAIKNADRIAAFYEATTLAGFEIVEARTYFGHASIPHNLVRQLENLAAWPANTAQSTYLSIYDKIADI
ncbi:MAG: HD family hydrolase [Hyphomicrobium sp.]|nr:HD family hydrolase [Hyphomicrobium sp.]